MKLQKLLQETIKTKINPRKPLFFSRVKLFINTNEEGWIQNCRGLLIFYMVNNIYYIAIMNIMKFQIDFDMELYTNFLSYCKFTGDEKYANCVYFLAPIQNRSITLMLVFQSKQQLLEFKRKMESEFYVADTSNQLEFLKRPEVQELIKQSQIDQNALQTHLKFKNQVEAEIKNYFQELQEMQKNVKHVGFKAYGLGRDQWKLEQNQKQFLKQKKKTDLIAQLVKLNKQNKMI